MPEASELPWCRDFLIAALRDLRPKRKDVQGVRLHLVYNIAREFYSDEEIRRVLNAGLKDRTLLIMARFYKWKDGNIMEKGGSKPLPHILRHFPIEKDFWRFSDAGKQLQACEDLRNTISRIYLYIREDGLPANVQRILSDAPEIPTPTQGQRILAAMKKAKVTENKT